jgi:hypothetical protein
MTIGDNYHIEHGELENRNYTDSGTIPNRNWTFRGILQTIFENVTSLFTFDSTASPTFDNSVFSYFDKD